MCPGSPTGVALRLAAASVTWAGVAVLGGSLSRRESLWLAWTGALVAGTALLCAPPVLSDDLFRYLWDGRVLSHGLDPYARAPADPALFALRDALYARVNNPEIPTIYPPLAELAFALADRVAHVPASPKALAFAAQLATIPVVDALARAHGRDGAHAALAWALSPLALAESALSGHVDALAALFLALGVLALATRRPWASSLAFAAAASVKLVGLALAPLVWKRSRAAAVLGLALSLVSVVVVARAGSSEAPGGLSQYARRWHGNEGAFTLLEAGATGLTTGVARLTGSPPRHVRVPLLRPWLARVRGTPLDPRLGLTAPKKAAPDLADFRIAYVASLLARLFALALVLALAVRAVRRDVPAIDAARAVLLATLLLAPQLHPWYVLWLLPLELASGGTAGLVLAAGVLVAYAPLDGWLAARAWTEPWPARALEHGLVWAAVLWELRGRPRKVAPAPS